MIELTLQEEREILARREQRRVSDAGGYGPAIKRSRMEEDLRDKLIALNQASLATPYGELPFGLDAATITAVERIQQIGFAMKNAAGDVMPFKIPSRVAWAIATALLGDRRP